MIKGASCYQRRNERAKSAFFFSSGSSLYLFGGSALIATYATARAAISANQSPLPGGLGGVSSFLGLALTGSILAAYYILGGGGVLVSSFLIGSFFSALGSGTGSGFFS